MDTQHEARDALKALLEQHGLSCATENEWVAPNARLPALRALWYPRAQGGQLDVQVLVEDGVLIEECFAGIGAGSAGLRDALRNFMVNSLHVLLAAFWGSNDPEQVTTAQWLIDGQPYTAYIGNLGTRASQGVTFTLPEALFPALEKAIRQELLGQDVHWVRVFFCNIAGQPTFEALLDNQDWPAGRECLEGLPWELRDGYYSVRNFMVLRKAEQAGTMAE